MSTVNHQLNPSPGINNHVDGLPANHPTFPVLDRIVRWATVLAAMVVE